MKTILFISACILILTSCGTPKEATAVVSIKHGTSFGSCLGYCLKEETYTATSMTYNQSSREPERFPEKQLTEDISEQQFDQLTEAIDWKKWEKLPETIGCPDCADGGAEYVEITTASGTKRVTFDANSDPEGLEKILKIFREKRALLEIPEAGNKY